MTTRRGLGDEEQQPPRRRGATRLPPAEAPEPGSAPARRPVRVARFVNAALIVLCLVGSLQALGLIGIEAQRLWHTEREIARLEAEIAAAERERRDLLEVAQRELDDVYREQLARRQGYVYPFETRFVGPTAAP